MGFGLFLLRLCERSLRSGEENRGAQQLCPPALHHMLCVQAAEQMVL